MHNTKVYSAATIGLDISLIEIEVTIESQGFPAFNIVGLADRSVEESKERIRAALKACGFDFPDRRITVNLAPADLPKKGSIFDFAIAIGILKASNQLKGNFEKDLFIGELALDGRLRSVNGVLPITMFAKDNGFNCIFVPSSCSDESSVVPKIHTFAIDTLSDAVSFLTNKKILHPVEFRDITTILEEDTFYDLDMSEIYGQEKAKRALEICAAGGHNLSMMGPPGSGKTLLSKALPSILPNLSVRESLEVTKVYSISGHLKNSNKSVITTRPFRSPHHTISINGLIGGGINPIPGEISLAHHGVLFIDEFSEMPRFLIEALRQPLEDGFITVSRASGKTTFPSRFIFIASYNPCPCGYLGDAKIKCKCLPYEVISYTKKLSGPILDRIDMFVEVKTVEVSAISEKPNTERSSDIKKRVQKARDLQRARFFKADAVLSCNADMSPRHIKELCPLGDSEMGFLKDAMSKFKFSLRSFHRIIKVARTIADLESSDHIQFSHLAEAIQFRSAIPNV